MLCSHLPLLKKNLLIAKSTFVLTAIELLSPIIIMLALLGLKSLFKKENLLIQDDLDYVESNSSLLFTNLNSTIDEENGDLNFVYICNERNLLAFVGKDFPGNLADKFIKLASNLTNLEFKYYEDFKTLSDYVE